MGPVSAIVVLVISWWLYFFMMLPIGVSSQLEDEEVVRGSEPGAPSVPNLRKKMIWATIPAVITTMVIAIAVTVASR